MTFRPTVLKVEHERELRWLGRLLLPGLFDGEHIFRIEALADGRTRCTQAERFSGILVRALAFGSTLDKTELGFAQMNTALKAQAEPASRSGDASRRRVLRRMSVKCRRPWTTAAYRKAPSRCRDNTPRIA